MVNILKAIGFLIISIVIGALVTFILTSTYPNSQFSNSDQSLFFWVFLALFLTIIFNYKFNRGENRDSRGYSVSTWGPPEDIRDRVISSPQFVGRFDKERGLLEATARMVLPDISAGGSKIYAFRGELLDQSGSTLELIPVEIKGDDMKWVGMIVEGDRVRVEGKMGDDGILHAKNAFNFSTNSWFGERRKK